ncbi:hypothetical protein M3Y98_00631600 [Aphelenchoides besseyi]|nr:hypothetical protein M3Y98_00631600 [Aphelenchoides besseyi]
MENNNYWTSNLNSLTCRELRGRLRSLQETIDENRQRKRHQSLDRQIRSARISSRLEYERPVSVDFPLERPPSVFSAVSSNNNSSTCVTCKRPLSVLDQNRPNSALTDGRPQTHLSAPISRQSHYSKLSFGQKIQRSVHFEDCSELMSQIEQNYPKLLSLLEPIVTKTDSDIGIKVLKALKQRDAVYRRTLQRTQEAMVLATRERRENLRRESAEAYENHLDCVGLIDEITRILFPKGDKFPTPLRTVQNQMHHLQRIFSSRSSFASSTETNVEVHSDEFGSNNSLTAPPQSSACGNQKIQQSMILNMTPELHSPTQPSQSDISSPPKSTVDYLQSSSPFPSNYKWVQSEQTDELAQCFLGAHRPFDISKFVPKSSFRLFYCLPKNPKIVPFSLPLTIAYRSNNGETYPFFNKFTREIEVFPVWSPYVRSYAQSQNK